MIEGTTGATSTGSGSTDLATTANEQLGKNEFLKLLVTQLKNQDPMNPMKGREMASQMAQFSSVEQLMQLNEKMAAQENAHQQLRRSVDHGTAAEMIDGRILAAGDRVQVPESGETSVTVDVETEGSATLELYDSSGEKVGSRDLGYLEAGRQEIDLGTADDGLASGVYRYDVAPTTSDSNTEVTTYTSGVVDGVRFGRDGPVLRIGAMEVPFGRVQEVLSSQ